MEFVAFVAYLILIRKELKIKTSCCYPLYIANKNLLLSTCTIITAALFGLPVFLDIARPLFTYIISIILLSSILMFVCVHILLKIIRLQSVQRDLSYSYLNAYNKYQQKAIITSPELVPWHFTTPFKPSVYTTRYHIRITKRPNWPILRLPFGVLVCI